MPKPFHIRRATVTDARAIARLCVHESCRHIRADCSPEGFRTLLSSLAARAVEGRLQGDEFHYRIAADSAGICGVCAMRETTHLYHLFVASEWHGRGIARQLWESARDDSLARLPSLERFTVNASTFARPVYLRLGFHASGGACTRNGIRSWPMVLQMR